MMKVLLMDTRTACLTISLSHHQSSLGWQQLSPQEGLDLPSLHPGTSLVQTSFQKINVAPRQTAALRRSRPSTDGRRHTQLAWKTAATAAGAALEDEAAP